ncbi:MAG: hypothetical protein RLZZ262_995, partial [Bacteroidota bacterium]
RIQVIGKLCQDPTGSNFFKILKQIEPQLNKKLPKHRFDNCTTEENKVENIAQSFVEIFDQKDARPTKHEMRLLTENMKSVRNKMQIEDIQPFTTRELEEAVKRANIRSAKGPDGVQTE